MIKSENASPKDLAEQLMNKLNTLCGSDKIGKEFIDQILNSHRTLQQTFMRDIICQFIKAEANNTYYDDRNKQTHELCVLLNNFIEDNFDKAYLPFI